MSVREERALELFSNGYNCAQAVFGVFCEEDGMEIDSAFKVTSGLGGGLRYGEVCGAVSGAMLAIGLKCGFYIEKDFTQKAYCYEKTCEFMEKFKEANNSILCRDLLDLDIYCPDDHKTPKAKEAHKTICPSLVAAAVRVVENMEFER